MTERRRLALLTATIAFLAFLLPAAVAHATAEAETGARTMAALLAGSALALALWALWLRLDRGVLAPLASLTLDLAAMARSRKVDRPLPLPARHRLDGLAESLGELVEQVRHCRRDSDDALAFATRHMAAQKAWLEVILRDLSEGVVVCNTAHAILLYNQAAVRLLGRPETMGLGRPLFGLVTRQPVLHALELLEFRLKGGDTPLSSLPFVCASVDSRAMLHGRMALIVGPDRRTEGYVLTLAEGGGDMAALAHDTLIRRALTRDLRDPIASLRAAAETIAAFPAMTARERAAFDEVILEECAVLSRRIDALEEEFRASAAPRWLMSDIYSQDLFSVLARLTGQEDGIILTMVGIPLWLRGDPQALMPALAELIRRIRAATGVRALDAEALLSDRHVYIELAWHGEPIAQSEIDSWLDRPLEGAVGGQTLRDVLDRHGAEPWSMRRRPGLSVLRLPLPAPDRPQFLEPPPPPPARPEFYDFDLLRSPADGSLGSRPLRELTYVVFDTETTGLDPVGGDRIVSIGAVRVVRGRVLTGETFERMVNPGRPIPAASVRFHGITDAMVADKPPLEVVLPQFQSFAGDAVLVAHNAAFDLRFLKLTANGFTLPNPTLDTLLLSAVADPDGDHGLDGIATRLGVPLRDRHSALGDALIAAEVLVRLFDLLEPRGIRTFDDAVRASGAVAQLRLPRG